MPGQAPALLPIVEGWLMVEEATKGLTSTFKREPNTKQSGPRQGQSRAKKAAEGRTDDGAGGDDYIKREDDPAYISSDGEEATEGPRVDIEHINLVSDDDDQDEDEKKELGGSWGLRPIRLERREHVERGVGVNTEASSKRPNELRRHGSGGRRGEDGVDVISDPATERRTSKGKGKEKEIDVEFVRDERRWRGVYEDDDAKVKPEPQDDGPSALFVDGTPNQSTVDPDAIIPDEPSSSTMPTTLTEAEAPKTRRRRHVSFRDVKPVLQTEEDEQEWGRHVVDVKMLAEELGPVPSTAVPVDQDGDVAMNMDKSPAPTPVDPKEGRIYLFQLPPILPTLRDPLKKEDEADEPDKTAPVSSKDEEPGRKGGKSIAIPVPASAVTKPSLDPPAKAPRPTEATARATGSHPANAALQSHPPQSITSLQPIHEALPKGGGQIGKLRVQASGRVTLSWGGTSLSLGRGIETGFVQDLVVAEVPRTGQGSMGEHLGQAETGRTATAVGGVVGKFVVQPDWAVMLR
ncbi:MAG: hypothetical protein M1817_003537 [Caeruleum heppii]|nr:MAG: hypothetical protein M1817_003537 [Caeruleum heppii]